MTVQNLDSDNSDDESDADDMVSLPPVDIYRRKYQLLLERCEVLQQDNDRLIHRIHASKKTTKRFQKDIQLLVERLDSHEDPFRTMPVDEPDTVTKPRPVMKPQAAPKQADKQNTTGAKKQATKRKSKADRPEKDPNAPKKPCNAFFQFCQEQRPLVIAKTNSENGIDPSKQEVTRQLAHRWRSLTSDEKR
ncbi:TCF3 fusion partner-like protein, partial [Operophtera brumata]